MSELIVPIPACDVTVREATLDDVAFIDRLQKMHSDRVGFMRTEWIETRINKREVIVAVEEPGSSTGSGHGRPVGYCMGVDRYKYRDDVGIIYQMNVEPGKQRGFVGATLLKAMFDRAAYGCRLFSCWCAQDIEANRFWESMGFVPLAYRQGSDKKRKGGRVHIFWQKRIREGDTTTPWWFPAKTDAGVMRADRIVLPIPPGKHWSDEMPVIEITEAPGSKPELTDGGAKKVRVSKKPAPSPKFRPRQFGGPSDDPGPAPVATEKPKREKKPKVKADPTLVAAARELRDRWLEHVNSGAMVIESVGKYDVTRALPACPHPNPLREGEGVKALLPPAGCGEQSRAA